MAAKPTTVPRWARTAGGVDTANLATPSSGEQDVGYTVGQALVSSSKTNWLFNWLTKWILYLKDGVFVADAGSSLAGLFATGDGAAPGISAAAGGGGSPARGALNLNQQATPSAPSNGDVWFDGTVYGVRIGGVTYPLALKLPPRTTVADAPYAASATDELITYTSLSASRVVTLPSALSNRQRLIIKDESGNASNTQTISVLAQGGQSVDGTANPTAAVVIDTPYGSAELYSNGANWFQLY